MRNTDLAGKNVTKLNDPESDFQLTDNKIYDEQVNAKSRLEVVTAANLGHMLS